MGNVPVTKQTVVYIDEGLRVMQDKAGELYIYARLVHVLGSRIVYRCVDTAFSRCCAPVAMHYPA